MPGRYIFGNKGHFQGVLVHSDGTLILTINHRTAENIVIDQQRLLDMQSEAVFRVTPFLQLTPVESDHRIRW